MPPEIPDLPDDYDLGETRANHTINWISGGHSSGHGRRSSNPDLELPMRDFDDFDRHFERTQRSISSRFWLIGAIQLVLVLGWLAILGGSLWLIGHMAGAW